LFVHKRGDLFGRLLKHILEGHGFLKTYLCSLDCLWSSFGVLHSRTELLDTTLCVDEGLGTSVERVAGTTNNNIKDWFDRTSYKLVATGTSNLNFRIVFWVYVCFHRRYCNTKWLFFALLSEDYAQQNERTCYQLFLTHGLAEQEK
jgi:hypothetical protein